MVSSEEQAFLDEARAWVRSGGDIHAELAIRSGIPSPRLHRATELGYCSVIRWLLDHGAQVESVTQRPGRCDVGSTPLHIAAFYGRCDAAVLLLDAGADVGARSHRLDTPLHYPPPFQLGVKMCKLLLSRGASLDARNSHAGRDPEAIARFGACLNNAAFLAEVRAAGGWAAYVAAPRNQLLALRRELPTRFRTAPCRERAQARLFLDPRIPDDVFKHVLTFWRSARDSEY